MNKPGTNARNKLKKEIQLLRAPESEQKQTGFGKKLKLEERYWHR